MLKQTFQYEDYNGDRVSEVFYFNLTKVELAENMWIKNKVEKAADIVNGPEHVMGADEMTTILDVVKDLMRLSYGVKSDDGKRFIKNDQLWTEFTQSAAYDPFLFSLFETPEKANAFMLGIMPKDLAAAAEKMSQAKRQGLSVVKQEVDEIPPGNVFANVESMPEKGSYPEYKSPVAPQEDSMSAESVTQMPQNIKDLAKKDPKDMTREELLEAFRQKNGE